MKFFSFESSKKLAEMGCVSETRHEYYQNINGEFAPCIGVEGEGVPAFTPFDFLSSEEYAVENCRKLWGEGNEARDEYGALIKLECRYDCGCNPILSGDCLDFNRHAMLDAPDQIKFVEEFL